MTINEAVRMVTEHTGQEITAETKLSDLGLDSLEFLELMVFMNVPDSAVPNVNTVQDLAA